MFNNENTNKERLPSFEEMPGIVWKMAKDMSDIKAMMEGQQNKLPKQAVELGYLTRKETCKRLGGISLPTLNEYTKTGRIKGNRIGRRVLYSPADIDAALTAIKTKNGGKYHD